MLGVLAIMGVIAVGGITAYQLTMSKHWVDKLEEASYMRAYTIGNQIRNRRPMSLSAYNKKNEQAYGTFSGDVVDLDTQFGIKISGVNQKVCEGIIGKVGGVSAIRSIVDDSTTALTATDCYEDNNTLTLVYNRDLSKTDIDGNLICEGGCGFYGVCEDGTCVCREDHYGDRCENAPLDCENGGSWNNQTNSCDCVGIYGGKVCTDRACSTDNDCVPLLGAGYKCNKTKGICEIQCVSNTTYVENYGCCPNDQLWNRGCCAGNGAKIQEVDGVQMCRRGSYGCPEGQIYDAKTKKCHLCENVTDIVKNTGFYSCSMCPNLVRVSKW